MRIKKKEIVTIKKSVGTAVNSRLITYLSTARP
jgi:hypothetical protein